MPNDYITKADAIKIVMDANLYTAEMVHEVNGMVKRISELPAADVAEVVHGKWGADADGDYYRCSACAEWQDRKTAYCPNCGAKMDGGEHHAE